MILLEVRLRWNSWKYAQFLSTWRQMAQDSRGMNIRLFTKKNQKKIEKFIRHSILLSRGVLALFVLNVSLSLFISIYKWLYELAIQFYRNYRKFCQYSNVIYYILVVVVVVVSRKEQLKQQNSLCNTNLNFVKIRCTFWATFGNVYTN